MKGFLNIPRNTVALALQEVSTFDAQTKVLDQDGVPVAWRIFAYGPFSVTINGATVDGMFTEAEAALIMAHFEQKGTRIPVDSEHYLYRLAERLKVDETDVLDMLGKGQATMGFGSLEKRDDGLWVVDVQWSELAHELMAADIFRWFSPVIRGLADGRLRITSLAMTNHPAIDQLDSIAARAEAYDGPDVCPGAAAGRQPVKQGGTAHQQGGRMKTILTAIGALLGIEQIALSDDGSVSADVVGKLTQLGTEIEALRHRRAAVDSFLGAVRGPLALSDDADINLVQGAVLALTETHGQNAVALSALQAELGELRAERENEKRQALIEQGLADGKLTQHLVDTWAGNQDAAALSAFLAAAPALVPRGEVKKSTLKPPADAVALSDADVAVCRIMGIDEAKYLEEKKKTA